MNKKQSIENFIKSMGITEFGIIKCRRFDELYEPYNQRKNKGLFNEFEEQDISLKINPNHYMSKGKSIISIGFPYLHLKDNFDNGFSVYTKGIDYHRVLKAYLEKICEYIKSLGGEAISLVDSNTLPERYIAYLSGVGFIGKNNLIINKKYGSYIFLGEIITDLEIYDEDKRSFKEIDEFKECTECDICYRECPSKAINKNNKNSNICVSYLTQKKELTDVEMKLINGRVFGCDNCQSKCPYNKNIEFSFIDEFNVFDFMNIDNTENLLELSNKGFKESYIKTSCGWRGKNVLKRNAMIRLAKIDKEKLKTIKSDSEYLNEYLNRLLKIYEI